MHKLRNFVTGCKCPLRFVRLLTGQSPVTSESWRRPLDFVGDLPGDLLRSSPSLLVAVVSDLVPLAHDLHHPFRVTKASSQQSSSNHVDGTDLYVDGPVACATFGEIAITSNVHVKRTFCSHSPPTLLVAVLRARWDDSVGLASWAWYPSHSTTPMVFGHH